MLTQRDVLALLEREPLGLRPLTFVRVREEVPSPSWADAIYDVNWNKDQQYRFVASIRSRVTSQALAVAAQQAKSLAFDARGTFPLLVVPYLSPSSLHEVEQLGISAVDLCGNGIIQVPHQWLVVRAGQRNRFGGSDPLRSAYRGVASLVARAFMVQPTFARVSDIRGFIEARGGRITLATVSKALARLEEDLVVARETKGIRLLQPDKLLSKLQASYQPPTIRARLAVSSKLAELELQRRLRRATEGLGERLALTGMSSASRQAVIAAEPITSFYCSGPPDELAKAASIDPYSQRHFADLELLQTDDERVYFDPREADGSLLASPLQTWLELTAGDKRSQEVAKELGLRLLRDLGERSEERSSSDGR
jgi:hypothetical protein